MNARLSLLLACGVLGACGGSHVDPSNPPREQQLAQDQQPAQDRQPAREQQPAWERQPPPPQDGSGTAESRPRAEPAPATPAPQAPETAAPEAAAEQPLFAPTPATVVRETELKAEPSLDAETLATLPEQTAVIIVDRRGGWFEVVHEEAPGWVRLLHVSSQPPGTHGPIPPELERAARVATGRAGGGNIGATTGTRGLTEEELREAEADHAELRRMEALGVDPAEAETYARAHGLARRSVPYPSDARGVGR